MNQLRISGVFGNDAYWYNDTGKDISVRLTIKQGPLYEDEYGNDGAFFYLSDYPQFAQWRDTCLWGVSGGTYIEMITRTATATIPAGKYLHIFSQGNCDGIYTVEILN